MTTPAATERTTPTSAGPDPHGSATYVPPDLVTVIEWPRDASRRADLATSGRARLLVLAPDDPPPLVWDDAEDWIRADADPAELEARLSRLALVAPTEPAPASRPSPVLDADGVLRGHDGRVAIIPAIETRILHRLLESPRRIVHRAALEAAGWPGRRPPTRALDARISRLRARVSPFGIHIRTVRGCGHLVELDP